jgi:hypothetical protein
MKKKLTLVLPCLGRPERTKRMVECIANQDMNDWEAYIMGDDCPYFPKMLHSDWYRDFINGMTGRGNKIYSTNLPDAGDRPNYGSHVINFAIKMANSEYFIFASNDDMIQSNHFRHYLSGIQNTDLDFVYYNSWVNPHNMIRMSQPVYGAIGHSELIIRTDFLKTIPPHGPQYGHDWKLIEDMMSRTDKHKKIPGEEPTYYIMSVPGKTEQGID